MLKCTLRSPKTINGGLGEKIEFFISEIFFTKYYVIWDPGGSTKETDAMVASGMSFRSG